MTRAVDKWVRNTVTVIGGVADLTDTTAVLSPHAHSSGVYLTVYDLAELFRKMSGTDARALEVMAHVMRVGHRFTDDPDPDPYAPEEPF